MTISLSFFFFLFLVIILVFCKSLFIQLYWVLVEAHRILLCHVGSFVVVHQRIHLQCGRSWLDSRVRKIPWKRDRLPTPVFLDFPRGSDSKESTCNAGDPGWIPGSERSPGKGIGYHLQCFWTFLVAQTVKNPPAMQETRVQSLGWEDPLEKGTTTHSSILA